MWAIFCEGDMQGVVLSLTDSQNSSYYLGITTFVEMVNNMDCLWPKSIFCGSSNYATRPVINGSEL